MTEKRDDKLSRVRYNFDIYRTTKRNNEAKNDRADPLYVSGNEAITDLKTGKTHFYIQKSMTVNKQGGPP
ncbi:MAG: hypothetical protein IJM76_02525 [Lachnospiraceae bacterium]|nr:hypothetical protein [Lachnospiraceae bacterium]